MKKLYISQTTTNNIQFENVSTLFFFFQMFFSCFQNICEFPLSTDTTKQLNRRKTKIQAKFYASCMGHCDIFPAHYFLLHMKIVHCAHASTQRHFNTLKPISPPFLRRTKFLQEICITCIAEDDQHGPYKNN